MCHATGYCHPWQSKPCSKVTFLFKGAPFRDLRYYSCLSKRAVFLFDILPSPQRSSLLVKRKRLKFRKPQETLSNSPNNMRKQFFNKKPKRPAHRYASWDSWRKHLWIEHDKQNHSWKSTPKNTRTDVLSTTRLLYLELPGNLHVQIQIGFLSVIMRLMKRKGLFEEEGCLSVNKRLLYRKEWYC